MFLGGSLDVRAGSLVCEKERTDVFIVQYRCVQRKWAKMTVRVCVYLLIIKDKKKTSPNDNRCKCKVLTLLTPLNMSLRFNKNK